MGHDPNDGQTCNLSDVSHTIRAFALTLPGAVEDFPWGEPVTKVNKKIFVFFGSQSSLETEFALSLKLPHSHSDVLSLPFAEPMGYGLGKNGWVTIRFIADDRVPVSLLQQWITESYRAVAPKKLIAQLDDHKPKK